MTSKMHRPGTIARAVARGYVSLREAAPMLGISYLTAQKLKAKGWLRCIQVGQVTKVTMDEIERFLEFGNYQEPTSPPTPPKPAEPIDDGVPNWIKNLNKGKDSGNVSE